MSLLVKGASTGRDVVAVTPASGLRYVGFSAHRLAAGERLEVSPAPGREVCVVILSGVATVASGDAEWRELGDRSGPFDDRPPWAVYLPGGAPIALRAHAPAELAICTAPGTGKLPPRLLEPGAMRRSTRGRELNTRFVTDILPETEPAESLLVVEVRTPTGHSSSYPPHKHDRSEPPAETALEEIYYHRLDPPQGFVFQRVYTDARDLDESHAVEDHDVVLVPRGYHPVVVPWGYRSYYLNVMAGPQRAWHFRNDPAHEWILEER
ncbi:5-deoxy-glucuronate isomerase [Anaeromyxobacter oryzae]|uniref:5-deoxy-glucuronate isomerase n=1 Tax=Anaeromyxobacter oryzae TaxID=2918170 RepID=A0ABM7X0V3_9BACT|nr:5-deoxy-glucuronate isomerase [Anaeromyxobacter oryzae]BDG05393.1 5-deoxy-glucuronate isomerase [Anaeromyxobacter oryzae]